MATCGSYSKPMLTSRFPRYRKHLLDTPKFMPAPTSLVFLRMARFSPVPHSSHRILPPPPSLAALYCPLLTISCYLTISSILPHSPGPGHVQPPSLPVFSEYFLSFTYNETLNHTMGWLPHSYLVSMPSPSLAADYYCTPTLCHYRS